VVVGFDLDMTLIDSRPGVQALDAVRRHRGRAVVVTAKSSRHVVDHLGLDVDGVHGAVWREGKAEALRQESATIYVGDHVHDVESPRAAGAVAVAVATGPFSTADLAAANADAVLDSLAEFPAWLDEYMLTRRLDDLAARLAGLESVLVAFSGGADSAFLLAAAVRALGPQRVVAATAYSDSLPQAERAPAADFCADLGVLHLTPQTFEMERAGYRANGSDRCFFCKSELLDVLTPLARQHAMSVVATGTNADDAVAGFRPGIAAAAERGAITPLRDAGLSKAQVREASRRWGLATWDKPAAACLSSRIAYGISVTPHRLARVERAEESVRAAAAAEGIPVPNLRVRDLGDRARLEVDAEAVHRVRATPSIVAAIAAAGFETVDIDPRGFRSGSMNERLRSAPLTS